MKKILLSFLLIFTLNACISEESSTQTSTTLSTLTSVPTSILTSTPTPIPQIWIDSVKKVNGKTDPVLIGNKLGNEWVIEGNGWVIDNVNFDPATLSGFALDDGMKLDDPRNDHDPLIDPRFGSEGEGQVHLRCYAEITLPNGSKVITGFVWFQQTLQPHLSEGIPTWLGISYSLGLGSFESTESMGGTGPCQTGFIRYIDEGKFETSFALVFLEQIVNDVPYRDGYLLSSLFTPLLSELIPPDEFWQTGNINLLPKVEGKPFLLATHFGFKGGK